MTSWKSLTILLLSLLLSSLPVAGALAQTDSPPREDPGLPLDPVGGDLEGWDVLTIPGLPADAVLGDVWATMDGVVYVWARLPAREPARTGPTYDGEGERLPDPPGVPQVGSSLLYRFDGMSWTVALRTPNEAGVALFGTGRDELFASTEDALGGAQLYRFDGASWVRELMPDRIIGRKHTLAGVSGDVYFRVDGVILRHDGSRLQPAYELPAGEAPMRGLVYLASGCQFVMCADGHWLHHDGSWNEVPAGMVFDNVEDAWGMRDESGELQMFAIGTDAAQSGLRIWHFEETNPVTHAGIWTPSMVCRPFGGSPDMATGLRLWGIAENEAYATGVVNGEGHMHRFDGNEWLHLDAPVPLGTVHGVWGTPRGTVWFSTEGGNIVRFQRANQPPDVAAARPSVARLWPPDLRLVPVEIQGVVDPDGDALTIEIVRITQDEAIVTDDEGAACPDATIRGTRAFVRAEHADGGDGRTYDIEFTATDRLGARVPGRVQVFAPHFVDTPCEPDPTTYNSLGGCPAPAPGRRPLETDATTGTLRVRYEVEEPMIVHLGVYDVAGRLRATLAEGPRAPGAHEVAWDMAPVESGVYFVKLRTRAEAQVRRVIVMH